MQYRMAVQHDLLTLAQMRWDFHCEDYPNTPIQSQEQFLQTCHDFLQRGLNSGLWAYWIAEEDATIIAHIFVYLFDPMPRPDQPYDYYGYMTNVYTKPAYRNRGIGSALIQHAINWARSQHAAFLMVSPSENAIPFYCRAGFADYNECMQLNLLDKHV